MSFVVVESVTRRYDRQVKALDKVSLEIHPGEWLAVMGPSGSGKTTLLNLLGGLDVPDEGRIVVHGVDLSALSRPERIRYRRESVGLVFQQFHLIPYLTALENVMLAQYLHSMADEPEAAQALESVGLGDRLQHLPAALSGGEKQRVCIARALINQPALVLADEPTGALDVATGAAVLDLLAELNRDGTTIALITHDHDVAARVPRQIRILEKAGMDLTHVIISHMGAAKDVSELVEVARAGVFMGIDKVSFPKGPTNVELADLVRAACEKGLERQRILSSDVARRTMLSRFGGRGYATVLRDFVPMLKERGIPAATIEMMLCDNPARMLTLAKAKTSAHAHV